MFIFELITSSASIALIGAIVIVLFTLNIAFISRVTKNIFTTLSIKIFSLGYAIPGVVLAVGIITPTSYMERAITSILDYPPENLLSGTFFLLLIAYLVRFSTISIKTIDSGFNKISSSYDLLASSFGYSKLQVLIKVHLPILLPTISSATILLFVDIVKELPMTLILRPFNFDTLSTVTYDLISQAQFFQSSIPSLIIILISLPAILIINRQVNKGI